MSSDLQQRAKDMAQGLSKTNPASGAGKTAAERKRIPMSVPVQRLEVAEIPGYHLHWIRGTPDRLMQAERAGYEFVHTDEVQTNNLALAGDATKTGNSDMGTRVSTLASISGDGEIGADGQPQRLYLMKLKNEYWEEDQRVLEDRNESIAAALRGGTLGVDKQPESADDVQARYVDKTRSRIPDMFKPKRRVVPR